MLPPEVIFINGPVRLTPSQVKVVDYLLATAEEAVFLTTAQLGRRLGVSDATVVRLAQALGFRGYKQLKDHLRRCLRARLDTVSRLKRTVVQVKSLEDVLTSVLQADLANLRLTAEAISVGTFSQVVKELHSRDEAHIIGLRSAYSLAQFLASAMRYLGRNVHLLTPAAGDLWTDLGFIKPGSVLVALSFPRYTRLTIEVAEFYKESGGTVISFSDSAVSPLAVYSDYVLPCSFRIDSFMESFVSALSLLNAVVTGVAFLDGEKSLTRLRHLERLWEEKGVYFQADERSQPSWAKDSG